MLARFEAPPTIPNTVSTIFDNGILRLSVNTETDFYIQENYLNRFADSKTELIKTQLNKTKTINFDKLEENSIVSMYERLEAIQNRKISYVQYTVQENGSCGVFASTFAHLCNQQNSYDDVREYLGIANNNNKDGNVIEDKNVIESRNVPILVGAYKYIQDNFPYY